MPQLSNSSIPSLRALRFICVPVIAALTLLTPALLQAQITGDTFSMLADSVDTTGGPGAIYSWNGANGITNDGSDSAGGNGSGSLTTWNNLTNNNPITNPGLVNNIPGGGTNDTAIITFNDAEDGNPVIQIDLNGQDVFLDSLIFDETGGNSDADFVNSGGTLQNFHITNQLIYEPGGGREIDFFVLIDAGLFDPSANTVNILNNANPGTGNLDFRNNQTQSWVQGANDTIVYNSGDSSSNASTFVAAGNDDSTGTYLAGTLRLENAGEVIGIDPFSSQQGFIEFSAPNDDDAGIEMERLEIAAGSAPGTGSFQLIRLNRTGGGGTFYRLDVNDLSLEAPIMNVRSQQVQNTSLRINQNFFLSGGTSISTFQYRVGNMLRTEFQNGAVFRSLSTTEPNARDAEFEFSGNGQTRFLASAGASVASSTVHIADRHSLSLLATSGALGTNLTVNVKQGGQLFLNAANTAPTISTITVQSFGALVGDMTGATSIGTIGSGAQIQLATNAIYNDRSGAGPAVTTANVGVETLFSGLDGNNQTLEFNGTTPFRGAAFTDDTANNWRGTLTDTDGDLNILGTGVLRNGVNNLTIRGNGSDAPVFNPASGTVNVQLFGGSLQFRTNGTDGLDGTWNVINVMGADTNGDGQINLDHTHDNLFRWAKQNIADTGSIASANQTINIGPGVRFQPRNNASNAMQGTANFLRDSVLQQDQALGDPDVLTAGNINLLEGSFLAVNGDDRFGGGATYNVTPGAKMILVGDRNLDTLFTTVGGTFGGALNGAVTDFDFILDSGAADDHTGLVLGEGRGVAGRANGNVDFMAAMPDVTAGLGVTSVNIRAPMVTTETNDLPTTNPFFRTFDVNNNLSLSGVHLEVNPVGSYSIHNGSARYELEYFTMAGTVSLDGSATTLGSARVSNGRLVVGASGSPSLTVEGDLIYDATIGPNDQQEFLQGTVAVGGDIIINQSGGIATRFENGIATADNSNLSQLLIDADNTNGTDDGLIQGLINGTMAQGPNGIQVNDNGIARIQLNGLDTNNNPGQGIYTLNQRFTSNQTVFQSGNNSFAATLRVNDTTAGNPAVTYNLTDVRINQDKILRIDTQSNAFVQAQINLNGTQGTIDNSDVGVNFNLLGVTKSGASAATLNVGVPGSQFNTFLLGTSEGDITLNIVNGDITAAPTGAIGTGGNIINTGGLATINGSVVIQDAGANELFVGNGQLFVGQRLIVQGAGQVVAANIGGAVADDPSILIGPGGTLGGGEEAGDGGAEILDVDILLSNDGTIDPFDGDVADPNDIGELDINGNLDLLGDTVFKLDISGATTAGVDYDTVDLLGGGELTIAPNSTLTVMVTYDTSGGSYSPMLTDVFNLIDYNGPDPTLFSDLIVTGADGTNAILQLDTQNGILQLTGIVPEPTVNLLLALATSLFLLRRRR
ncbi:MAG: hypothetical protein AAGD22_05125 [Verrucomicrobiota bacterium]